MERREEIISWLTLGLTVLAVYLALIYAPFIDEPKIIPRIAQKIFYFHVPGAWVGFFAFLVVFVSSIAFLKTSEKRYDSIARVSAEIGVVFSTITLITGPIWGKAAWGAWWDWGEPRLVTFLVLWLLYIGYIILNRSVKEDFRRARYAAVFGIVAFIDVPIVFLSVRWYRTVHPGQPILESGGLSPEMRVAFFLSLFVFTVLYYLILRMRLTLHNLEEELKEIKEKMEE